MNTGIHLPKLLAINPNSSDSVTASVVDTMRKSLPPERMQVVGVTCTDGPPGIVTQAHYEDATKRMAERARRGFDADVQAVVIACFSDPGLREARGLCTTPLFGLGEAGMLAALDCGQRVGVIAVADAAIPRHLAYWQHLGVAGRVAGERALNLPVAASGDAAQAFERMKAAAQGLRDEDRADVLLLGCAGMSALRGLLQDSLGLPVIDPCEAAALAAAQVARPC